MRLERAMCGWLLAAALLLGDGDAFAFCRYVTHSDGYPRSTCLPQEGQRPLYWKSSCVGYHMSQAASKYMALTDLSSIMAGAFAGWISGGGVCYPSISVTALAPTASTTLGYEPDKPNENIILFDEFYVPNIDTLLIERSTVTFDARTGELLDVDLQVNTWLPFVIEDPVDTGDERVVDLRWVMTHAAGHFLGLDHANTDEAVMKPIGGHWYPPSAPTPRPWIKDDDYQGLCAIYPQNGVRTTTDASGTPTTVNATACNLFVQDNCGGEPVVGHGCSMSASAKSPSFGLVALLATFCAVAFRRLIAS